MVDGKVYIITFKNGMSYIGVTIQPLRVRILSHIWKSKKGCEYVLYNAMRKYNYDFTVDIIAKCNDWDELMELEKSLIKEYNTKAPNGYNIADGGRGVGGVLHTEERKIKTRHSLKKAWAAKNPEIRKEQTAKAVSAMNKSLLNPIIENKRRAGISKTMKDKKIGVGENNAASKLKIPDVIDIKTRLSNGEKESEIAKFYSVNRKLVNMIKNGKRWSSVTVNN